jgi:glycerophosphoryl diester phosphodiesterase
MTMSLASHRLAARIEPDARRSYDAPTHAGLRMKRPIPVLFAICMAAHGCSTPPPAGPDRTVRSTPLYERLCALATSAPIVVGHRGSAATHPENTTDGFLAAVEFGVGMVEFDVRQTADDALVCLHDETVDRTTDGASKLGRDRVAVRSLSQGQLRQLDAGAWRGTEHAGARVPTLGEALDAILTGAIPMIEHKDGSAELYVREIRERGLVDDVLLQSFDWTWLARVRELEPDLTLGALGEGRLTSERLAWIERLDVSLVHWHHRDLRVEDVRALRARGYLVCTYTVDGDLELIGCAAAGLDAVTTNDPARLVDLQRRGLARR